MWKQIKSTSLFYFRNKEYALIGDRYYGWLNFKKLKESTSKAVINHLKDWFSVHGIPVIIYSDSVTQ